MFFYLRYGITDRGQFMLQYVHAHNIKGRCFATYIDCIFYLSNNVYQMNIKKVYSRIQVTALLLLFTGSIIHAQVSTYTFTATTRLAEGLIPAFICETDDIWIKQPVTINAQGYFVFPPGQMDYVYAGCQGSNAAVVRGPGFPIGFDFVYDGQVFDRFAVSANGYIKLGKSGEDIVMYNDTLEGGVWKDGNNALRANVISAQQLDVPTFTTVPNNGGQSIDGGFTIGRTTGLPGQRVLAINGGFGMTYRVGTGFYIYLFEGSNKISISFRSGLPYDPAVGATKVAVGLRGKEENNTIENLNIRKVTQGVNTWATSVAGTSAADLCDFSSASLPSPDYLTYTWTPPVVQTPPVCPFIYLTYFIFEYSGSTIPSDYPQGIIYGTDEGDGNTGEGGVFYASADGSVDVARNPVLNWSPVADVSTTYDVYFGTDNPAVTLVSQNQTATSYTPPAPYLAPNTDYYYRIVAKNAYGSSPGCTGKITTGSVLHYCDRMPSGTMAGNITFNTIAYTANSSNAGVRRLPVTAPYTTTVQRNGTYSLSVTTAIPPYPQIAETATVSYFIDWNQDGDFDDAGESNPDVLSVNPGATRTLNTITVPNTAVLGNTVLRIKTAGQAMPASTACNPYNSAVDFVITVAPVTACAGFTIHPAITNVSCFGKSDGGIDLNVSGGTAPYAVTWMDGSAAGITRTGLARGVYQASSVTDAAGCEVSSQLVAVLQPGHLQLDTATVPGYATDLTVLYGTAPYTYQWSNDSTSSNPAYFTPGTYDVTVTDARGCDTTMHDIVIKKAYTTAVFSAKDNSFTIIAYPNPTTGILYLQSRIQQVVHIQFMNMQGKIMEERNYTIDGSDAASVDITSFSEGIYFLKVTDDTSTGIVKIIKY